MASLYISAARQSSGKTSVAVGLGAALTRRGLTVQPFKKGPDYIDPMWLARACARPCYNLDFHTQNPAEITALFAQRSSGCDLSLIEGTKGLFDGLDPEGSDCNAALAKLLDSRVVLVIDAKGMTRGIAPLVLGYVAFDRDVTIAGVILNNLAGSRHEQKLRAALEHYTDVPVLGALGHKPCMELTMRHLGLMPSNEARDADQRIAALAECVGAGVDLDRLIDLCAVASSPTNAAVTAVPPPPADVRIGIAMDSAFGFYYPDDLERLQAAGAELVPLDTLHEHRLPEVDGLFIGGGFPETQLAELEANRPLRAAIRAAIEAGLPTYAECGGLMYLAQSIEWRGTRCSMVGALPGRIIMQERPVGKGYTRLTETASHPWPHPDAARRPVNAHEFHYSHIEGLPADTQFAFEVQRGVGVDGKHDGIVHRNVLACYCHLRDVGGLDWTGRFVDFVRRHKRQRSATRAHASG